MAGLKIFVAVVAAFVMKEGAFSCSLRSHKSGSSLCSSSDSNSTSIPHHTTRLHTTSSSFNTSPTSSSCSSSVLPSPSNGSASFSMPIYTPATTFPVPESILSSKLSVPSSYNHALLNFLIKLLSSSSESITSTALQITPSSPSISPSNSCSSSVLPSLSCGSTPLSTISPFPSLQLSAPTPTFILLPSPGANPNLRNLLMKLLPSFTKPTSLPTSKLTHLSPPYPLFIPAVNTNSLPPSFSKPHSISYPNVPPSGSNSCSTSIFPGQLCSSTPQSKLRVPVPITTQGPEAVPAISSESVTTPATESVTTPASESALAPASESALAPASEAIAEQAPEEFPVQTPTSTSSTFSGHNQAIINLLHKLLLSNHMPKLNKTSTPVPVIRPHNISSTCETSSGSNSCSSNVSPKLPSVSVVPPKLTPVFVTPRPVPVLIQTSTSSIPFGYNPAFMKLLIKQLLSSSFSLPQPALNTTLASPDISNQFPVSTLRQPISHLNPSTFNVLSNLSSDSAPPISTIQNLTFSNNSALINYLFKMLSSSNDSKSPNFTSSSSSIHSMSTSNTTTVPILSPNLLLGSDPCTTSFGPLPDLLSKLLIPTSGLILPSATQIPSSVKPLPILKPFPDTVPVPTPLPNPCKSSPLPDLNPCHLKHTRPPQLPGSTSSGVGPCHQNTIRPLGSPSPSPYSLPPSKLSSGCKHPSST